MIYNTSSQRGAVNPLLVTTIALAVLSLAIGAFAVWAFVNYTNYKNNTDQISSAAAAEARRQQSEEDEKRFAEREKEPTRQFVGPDELGRVQLNYPKTWSVYVDKDGRDGREFQAYFQPLSVPPVSGETPYALRVSVTTEPYEKVLEGYRRDVEQNKIKSTPIQIAGENGTRLDGEIERNVQGVMVIFKVRDKTLRVFTESRTFQPDLENIILTSLKFNR